MPTYPLLCSVCDTRFEQTMSLAQYQEGQFQCPRGHTEVKRDWAQDFYFYGYGLNMPELERQFWYQNKKWIEKNKHKLDSGQWSLEGKSRLREFEPDFKNYQQ